MSKPIEVGCLVLVVGGNYPEFLGKVGTVLEFLPKDGKYPIKSNTNLWAKHADCWVVDFNTAISAKVFNNVNGREISELHTLDKMIFVPSLLIRINGDGSSLEDSQCDEISRVKEVV